MRAKPGGLMARVTWLSDLALCFIRKFWRPLVCISMGLTLLVNGVVIPLVKMTVPDLIGLAAVVAAMTPFAWLRTHEKVRGVDTPQGVEP